MSFPTTDTDLVGAVYSASIYIASCRLFGPPKVRHCANGVLAFRLTNVELHAYARFKL